MTTARGSGTRGLAANSRVEFRRLLGANLRELRRTRGMTQMQLSCLVGTFTQASLSNYESGRREIGLADALAVCQALDVSLAELLSGCGISQAIEPDGRCGRAEGRG